MTDLLRRILLAPAVATVLAGLPLSAQDSAAPAAPGFWRILYLHGGPPHDDAFWQRVEELGFDAVSLAAGADPAEPGRHGLRFYADQAIGKGTLELREATFSAIRDAYERSRDPADLVRPSCLSDPAVLDRAVEALTATLDSVLPYRPLGLTLGDEISLTRHANPLDFCTAPACLAAFRTFLMERYASVEALGRAWNTSVPAWEDVVPFTTDRIRQRELGSLSLPRHLRPWADHLEFEDGKLAQFVGALSDVVRERSPALPCGLTGMQPPSAFGGHDYGRLLPSCSLVEAYDIGGAADLAASLAPHPRRVRTLFPPADGEPVALVAARLFDAVAHGESGVIVWSAGDVLDDSAEPTPYGAALRSAFTDLGPAADRLAGATIESDPVWVVESQASVRAWWMLDSAGDGSTWIRRLSSYEEHHSTSLAARRSWQRLLGDLGIRARAVVDSDLPQRLREDPPRLLVLPAILALSDEAAAAIETYVTGGGVVLADHGLGLYDEHLELRDEGALDRLFGIEGRRMLWADQSVRQGRPDPAARLESGAAAAEGELSAAVAEPAGRYRVQIEHHTGEGFAVYLNLAVCEYADVRLDPARHVTALDLRQRVRRVLWAAGVQPEVTVRGTGLPTCVERTRLRGRDGRRYVAIRLDALDAPALAARLAADGAHPVTVSFDHDVVVRDLAGAVLGRGRQVRLALPPWTGSVIAVEDVR